MTSSFAQHKHLQVAEIKHKESHIGIGINCKDLLFDINITDVFARMYFYRLLSQTSIPSDFSTLHWCHISACGFKCRLWLSQGILMTLADFRTKYLMYLLLLFSHYIAWLWRGLVWQLLP